LSLTIMKQGETISLRESWSSSGVASVKSIRSCYAYGWVEKYTPFSNLSTFSSSDKYFHTMCDTLDVIIECMCLWLSFTVFEQLIEMLIFFCKLLYLQGLEFTSV
jgi:hypothetical protein